jgi:hypothetical protein
MQARCAKLNTGTNKMKNFPLISYRCKIQYLPLTLVAILSLITLSGFSGLNLKASADSLTGQGSIGIEGTIASPPPAGPATITTPSNGTTFTNIPIALGGLCTKGLLIKVFDNGIFDGSEICSSSGSYTLSVALFNGVNQLIAIDYDALGQSGPESNLATVTFNDAQFLKFGTHVSLSSTYAEKGAAPGNVIDWPITITGGNGPYAISVDWGDGTPSDLLSDSYTGTVNISHTYNQSGVYEILIKATDINGGQAFLQLVGQSTGAITSVSKPGAKSTGEIIEKSVIWWPPLAMLPLIIIAFWLGKRTQVAQLKERWRNESQ